MYASGLDNAWGRLQKKPRAINEKSLAATSSLTKLNYNLDLDDLPRALYEIDIAKNIA